MVRFGKKWGYWGLGFLGGLLLLSILLTAVFEDKIGDRILKEVQKSLTTKLEVKAFNLSLFRSFPNVSAELLGVTIQDAQGGGLLEAGRVSFRLGLFSLFKEKKVIKRVIFEDGALVIKVDKKGRANYLILKPSEEDEKGSDFSIDLVEAQLRNIELVYANAQTDQEVALLLEDAFFTGAFNSKEFSVESLAKLKSKFVDFGKARFLAGKDIGYAAKIFVNLNNGFYDLEKLDVAIDKNVFKVDGYVDGSKEGTDLDLVITCDKGNIESVIQLLPEQYLDPLADFSGKGQFLFETTIKGRLNARETPAIQAKMVLENGRINSPRLTNDFKDVSLTAQFTNGKGHNSQSSVFTIPALKGYFNRELIEMDLKIQNFDEPYLDFNFDGAIPMAAVYKLFNYPAFAGADGELEIEKLFLKGRYKDMIRPNTIHRVDAGGVLDFDDVKLEINDEKILLDRGSLILTDNELRVDEVVIEGAGSKFTLNGSFKNLLPVLFADSLNSQDAELVFESSLNASEMDFDRLVGLSKLSESERSSAESKVELDSMEVAQNEKRAFLADFLNGTFEARIDQFNYDDILGEDFLGKFTFNRRELEIEGEAKGMEGYFDIKGTMFFEKEPYLTAKIECNEINITDFFQQSKNFGQDFITDENLIGTLTARLLIDAFWDEQGVFQDDKLLVYAGLSVEDGELKGLKILESFSDYIHLKDLQHIVFSDLENWLEIRNKTVYLPVMFVQSNALNMTVSGSHTFDHRMDYNFKINAGQVLINYLRPHNPLLKPQKAERNGWFNLYYTIRGTLDDYDFETNKKRVKDAFENSDRRKRQIQKALTDAFGPIEFDTEPLDWKDAGSPNTQPATGKSADDDEFIDW